MKVSMYWELEVTSVFLCLTAVKTDKITQELPMVAEGNRTSPKISDVYRDSSDDLLHGPGTPEAKGRCLL